MEPTRPARCWFWRDTSPGLAGRLISRPLGRTTELVVEKEVERLVAMKNMKLGDFISQTLKEIIDGVSTAQEYASHKDAEVNPRHVNWSDTKQSFFVIPGQSGPDKAPMLTPIDFDVLLAIREDDSQEAGIGVFAAALGIGAKGKAQDTSESSHRIKFQILSRLPQQK
jgi:hypothetical protein